VSMDKYLTLDDERYDPRTGKILSGASGVPKRAVALAVGLFLAGCALLTSGLLMWYEGFPHALSMIIIGSIIFLPGFYFTRIAYKAWRGVEGFSFSDIPEV